MVVFLYGIRIDSVNICSFFKLQPKEVNVFIKVSDLHLWHWSRTPSNDLFKKNQLCGNFDISPAAILYGTTFYICLDFMLGPFIIIILHFNVHRV